jgi:hypothetical protein
MPQLKPLKPSRRARVGLYSAGLQAYWDQFPGLRERLLAYGHLSSSGCRPGARCITSVWSIRKVRGAPLVSG